MIKGLDISKFQSGISMSAIKNAGMDFVILRGGYTGYGDATSKAKDPNFETFYSQAKAQGLKVGAYYFSIATNYQKGVDEANWFYNNCLKGKTFEYPIYIDVEEDTGGRHWLKNAGKDATTQGTKGFCETLEKLGYYVGIYASDISGFKEMLNVSELTQFDKWVARYGSKPSYVTNYGIHQASSSYRINGYNGNLDYNESYKDYPTIIKNAGLNGFAKGTASTPSTPTTNATKSNDEIANEVIAGKWGNGDDRKNRLTNAGYNYTIIQGIVNNKLGGNNTTSNAVYYTVKKGDSLWNIAVKYYGSGNKYPTIKSLNGLTSDTIYAGQKLRVK